jgi:hypothetical protein
MGAFWKQLSADFVPRSKFLGDLPPIPAVIHTNHEARQEGLKHYTLIEAQQLDRGPANYDEVFGPW